MKKSRFLLLIAFLLFSFCPGLFAQEKFTLKADNQPIQDFLKEVARITGKNLLLDPSIQGSITVVSPAPLTREEVWEVAKSALSLNGFTMVEYGAVVKIVRKEKAASEPIPTVMPKAPAKQNDESVTAVLDMQFVPPSSLLEPVTALLGPDGKATVAPGGKSLVVIDSEANVARIKALVAHLDTKDESLDIVAIPLEHAGAGEVAAILTQLFDRAGGMKGTGSRCRFTSEPRSNSLIIRAPAEDRNAAKKIAARIDRGEATVNVTKLRNMDADQARSLLLSLTGG